MTKLNVKDKLEIILITYNRKPYLEATLNSLLDKSSPVRDYDIKILDNNSTDGTTELCQQYIKKFSNITYIKNNRNIGAAGNCCRAMEIASKDYLWVLCDNDYLDFSAWNEVEKFIEDDADLVVVCNDYFSENQPSFEALVLNQITFWPSAIYKTSHITDNVMSYMMCDTYTGLPNVALGCAILNAKGKIDIVSKSMVTLTDNVKIESVEAYDYDRIPKEQTIKKHELCKLSNFYAGIASCFDACQDKKIREQALINFTDPKLLNGYGPFCWIEGILASLKMNTTSNYIFVDFYEHMPKVIQKRIIKACLILFCASSLSFLKKYIFRIDKTPKRLKLCFFNTIKIRIWKYKKVKEGNHAKR